MTYVRNAWYVAAWSHELKVNTALAATVLDEPIVIWRAADGSVAALVDRCVHRLAPLSMGRCEGANLRCMYHGLLFAPDGKVVEVPGQETIPAQAKVRRYPIVDRHNFLWVWMGDAVKADEALIPPVVGLDQSDWKLGYGHLDYAAEARLINDNLLDFSHVSYLHAESFRLSETWARTRPKVTKLDRGVHVERWIEDEPGLREGERVDTWSSYDFLIPGVLLMLTANYPNGTAKACGYGPPTAQYQENEANFSSQVVTPLTAKTSRYFYSWGPRVGPGDEAVRELFMKIADKAFNEDKVMIEAQQRVLDTTPNPRFMPLTADKGVTMFNLIVEQLARAESELGTDSHKSVTA